jgi:hypothetical protein
MLVLLYRVAVGGDAEVSVVHAVAVHARGNKVT